MDVLRSCPGPPNHGMWISSQRFGATVIHIVYSWDLLNKRVGLPTTESISTCPAALAIPHRGRFSVTGQTSHVRYLPTYMAIGL